MVVMIYSSKTNTSDEIDIFFRIHLLCHNIIF